MKCSSKVPVQPDCVPGDHGGRAVPRPTVNEKSLERAVRLFKALGDVSRLRLLAVLAQGEACVSELADQDGLSTVSQRLRILHQARFGGAAAGREAHSLPAGPTSTSRIWYSTPWLTPVKEKEMALPNASES